MTEKQIYRLFGEAANYADPEAFASDAALSLLDPEDPGQEIDMGLYAQLQVLWSVANDPFRRLLERMELNQSQCATRFCIPLRTVQDWAGGRRTSPPYVRLMMAEAVGLLDIRQ